MSLMNRVKALTERCQPNAPVFVVLPGSGSPDHQRPRVERARRQGRPVRVLRFGLQEWADTVEEAEALVASHRERRGDVPITVYRRGSQGSDVLAEWDPGKPAWLRDGDDDIGK